MSSPQTEMTTGFDKVGKAIEETGSIFLRPFLFLVSAARGKFTATQLKYLREQVVYYFDPMSLEKDVEIAQIQKMNPSLWRVWRMELEAITMMYYVILVVTKFASGLMPEMLTALPRKEQELLERQAKFLSALAEAIEQTEDAQMKASVYRLGRRLFAGWAASSEAREFMANLPKLAQEREEYIASFYGQAGMGKNNVHQQLMAKLLTKFFDDGNSWSSLPLYTAEQMRNQEAYLRYLLANPEATIE